MCLYPRQVITIFLILLYFAANCCRLFFYFIKPVLLRTAAFENKFEFHGWMRLKFKLVHATGSAQVISLLSRWSSQLPSTCDVIKSGELTSLIWPAELTATDILERTERNFNCIKWFFFFECQTSLLICNRNGTGINRYHESDVHLGFWCLLHKI